MFERPTLHKFLRSPRPSSGFSAISHPPKEINRDIKSDTTTDFHITASCASDANAFKPEEMTPSKLEDGVSKSRSIYYVLVEKGFGVRRGKRGRNGLRLSSRVGRTSSLASSHRLS